MSAVISCGREADAAVGLEATLTRTRRLVRSGAKTATALPTMSSPSLRRDRRHQADARPRGNEARRFAQALQVGCWTTRMKRM
jgi:hypothetical protein